MSLDACGICRPLAIPVLLFGSLLAPVVAFGQSSSVEEAAAGSPPSEVEEIVVQGRARTFYRVDESSLGTKTPTAFLEIPQSVQVLSRQLIEDQAALQITDLYRSISGVSLFSYSGVVFRGFRQDEVLYDGLRGDPFGGFAVPQLFNIERVEILKGPAGMLYGSGQPGGLINYVTKQPDPDRAARVIVGLGDDRRYGMSAEYSNRIDAEGRYSFRVAGFVDNEEPFRFNTDHQNRIVETGLRAELSESLEATLQLTYLDQDLGANRLRGVPVDDDGNFLTDIRWNHNEPGDFQRLEARVVQTRLDYTITPDLSANLTVRYFDNERTQNYHEPRGLVDLDGDGVSETMRREFRDQLRENSELAVAANLVHTLRWGRTEHTWLVGGDWFHQEATGESRTARTGSGLVPDLSLFDPVYGEASPSTYLFDPVRPTDNESVRLGVYVQDQVRLSERWLVTGGLRYDRFDDENHLNGEGFDDGDLSSRVGVIFQPTPEMSLYTSYSESFSPQAIASQNPLAGGPFAPERGKQVELGIKTELWDGRLQLSSAVYQIDREDILQGSPLGDPGQDGMDDQVAVGHVRSRGLEMDLVMDVTDAWVFTASYALNRVRILDDNGMDSLTNFSDGEFANAPRHQLGLWTRFDLPQLNSAIAFGMDYVGDRVSLDGQAVQAYTTFDVSWRTYWRDYEVQVNVRNLFDEEYAASGFIERAGHFPGEPRRVYLQLKWDQR